MILLLDTSTPVCYVTLVDGDQRFADEWPAGRELAKGVLGYLQGQLEHQGWGWQDVTGIGVLRGPGSFTGLRIGLSVANTLADGLGIPIVGVGGEGWQQRALDRLAAGDNDRLVMPEYGGEAHITTPRK